MPRRTSAFAGFGIVFLFGYAVANYGVFHLMDYPIFLGLAYYLISLSFPRLGRLRVKPLAVVRTAASVTLMWASIEKWAYPSWTLPIYMTHGEMTFGASFDLFMCAAGVIEFGLAFALLLGPLVRRASAIMLMGLFVSAIFEFGKVDAIGHSMIIAILMLIASDESRQNRRRVTIGWLATPAWTFAATLAAFLGLYYGLHAEFYGTRIF